MIFGLEFFLLYWFLT